MLFLSCVVVVIGVVWCGVVLLLLLLLVWHKNHSNHTKTTETKHTQATNSVFDYNCGCVNNYDCVSSYLEFCLKINSHKTFLRD